MKREEEEMEGNTGLPAAKDEAVKTIRNSFIMTIRLSLLPYIYIIF